MCVRVYIRPHAGGCAVPAAVAAAAGYALGGGRNGREGAEKLGAGASGGEGRDVLKVGLAAAIVLSVR